MLFKGYFINLDRSTDRRQDLENHLLEMNLAGQYQRFAAVDGSRLAHVSQQFKPGEVGCYKSHLDLISSLDGSYHAHIMEDDARLSPKFASIVQSIPDDVIDRFDIIFIDTFVPFDLKLIQKLLLIQEELKKSGETRIKLLDAKNFYFAGALLHKDLTGRHSPNPRRSYATATVSGVPSCVKRLSNAARTCSSAT